MTLNEGRKLRAAFRHAAQIVDVMEKLLQAHPSELRLTSADAGKLRNLVLHAVESAPESTFRHLGNRQSNPVEAIALGVLAQIKSYLS